MSDKPDREAFLQKCPCYKCERTHVNEEADTLVFDDPLACLFTPQPRRPFPTLPCPVAFAPQKKQEAFLESVASGVSLDALYKQEVAKFHKPEVRSSSSRPPSYSNGYKVDNPAF